MSKTDTRKVAIVNYEMGNLFSVKQACEYVGLHATITSSKQDIRSADAVILPGVGAFGDAMETLKRYDLIETLKKVAASQKIFIGICLGMQLLMDESYEFGHHQGLGIVKGSVVRFDNPVDISGKCLKVPQVGWNRIYTIKKNEGSSENGRWKDSLLEGITAGEFMYFVHSYYVMPQDSSVTLSLSQYGNIEFCSSLQAKNIFACQFHPERSGTEGLKIYKNLALFLEELS